MTFDKILGRKSYLEEKIKAARIDELPTLYERLSELSRLSIDLK